MTLKCFFAPFDIGVKITFLKEVILLNLCLCQLSIVFFFFFFFFLLYF